MRFPSVSRGALRFGFLVGLIFGSWNVLYSWFFPLADDTLPALLAFYGPMFLLWAVAAFLASRRTGTLSTAVVTGAVVAFATFCIYNLLVVVRVNLFLDELTGRADWRNLMAQFKASGYESLRTFVNLENIKGAPFKIAVASTIGAVMGLIGGGLGRLAHERSASTARDC